MTMKKNHKFVTAETSADDNNNDTVLYKSPFTLLKFRRGPAIATCIAFLLSVLIIMYRIDANSNYIGDIREFEVGKVAERDIVAVHGFTYIDEVETQRLINDQLRHIPAVFEYFNNITDSVRQEYSQFAELSKSLFRENVSAEIYRLRVFSRYAAHFSDNTLSVLFSSASREDLLQIAAGLLDYLMERGIFSIPERGLEMYNADSIELLRNSGMGGVVGRERIDRSELVTLFTLKDTIDRYMAQNFPNSPLRPIAFDILAPFIRENAFFSSETTRRRVEEMASLVEPVVRFVEPGSSIIRKGFIITPEDMAQLTALKAPSMERPGVIIGQILLCLLIYACFVFIASVKLIGRRLSNSEIYLLSALTAIYMIGAAFIKDFSFNTGFFPISIVLPTALMVMLPSILIGAPLALAWSMVLPLGAFVSHSFDVSAYIFAVVSGVAASYALKGAEKRMDLVKAGLIIAVANSVAVTSLLLFNGAGWEDYLPVIFWAAFNGIAAGMLVLGILPLLEHLLNAATSFRLIELSDLNTPLLKRLFTVASGTYSHSIMVANLAEAACQQIGANALLARVGAYYHDIGKMEQPDYFVENQASNNKHDDLPPSLSATIIRSHVRIGVEKARSMKLPQEVTDIVAEHHGNSIITWFYNKALEQDPNTKAEDFSYPGSPPRSRESAVVMLSDVCEAAVRTLENPTADRIRDFITGLINSKIEHGQLAESELTFRDLETIKYTFVQVLAGYYHTRIKYPKLPPPKEIGKSS